MDERFKVQNYGGTWNKRITDRAWFVWDNMNDKPAGENLTKSQAEQVKKALDEATEGRE